MIEKQAEKKTDYGKTTVSWQSNIQANSHGEKKGQPPSSAAFSVWMSWSTYLKLTLCNIKPHHYFILNSWCFDPNCKWGYIGLILSYLKAFLRNTLITSIKVPDKTKANLLMYLLWLCWLPHHWDMWLNKCFQKVAQEVGIRGWAHCVHKIMDMINIITSIKFCLSDDAGMWYIGCLF